MALSVVLQHTLCGRGAGVGEEVCSLREDRSRPRPALTGGRGTCGIEALGCDVEKLPRPC